MRLKFSKFWGEFFEHILCRVTKKEESCEVLRTVVENNNNTILNYYSTEYTNSRKEAFMKSLGVFPESTV